MKYSKTLGIAGIGALERSVLSKLLRHTQTTISEAAAILNLNRQQAAKRLSHYAKKGWLKRIYPGIYMPVPLSSPTHDIVVEEPFVLAEKLFSPCYIGGMSAANYWDLTEQIFHTVTVMTMRQVRQRHPSIAGSTYTIHTIKSLYFFGLKSIWFHDVKVKIADPTRTILDMLLFPNFCGGLRFNIDVLQHYYQSQHKDIDLLISYLTQVNNGAAIKRMGFLAEKYFPEEPKLIDYCLQHLTKGYVKMAPSLKCSKLDSRWRLWIPERWKINR